MSSQVTICLLVQDLDHTGENISNIISETIGLCTHKGYNMQSIKEFIKMEFNLVFTMLKSNDNQYYPQF